VLYSLLSTKAIYKYMYRKSILLVALSIYIMHYIYALQFNDYYKRIKEFGGIESYRVKCLLLERRDNYCEISLTRQFWVPVH
jgi:hypothetical protein